MSTVFYRKYRPHTFEEIQGQEHVKTVLVNSILSDSVSHGYLFSGPRGTGKTSMARVLAKAVNSENFNKNKDVSEKDEHFHAITNGESMDIIEMDAASNRGIEDIRSLKESVNYLPSVLKFKVYIIDEAHMLTKEAFNALLKTLEEPPAHVIFILATTEPHKIPVTILSRVVRFDFTLADRKSLKSKIDLISKTEGIQITDEAFDKIFKISGGSYRDSESLIAKLSHHEKEIDVEVVEKVLGIPSEEKISKFVSLVAQGNVMESLQMVESLESQNISMKLFVEEVLEHLISHYMSTGESVKSLFALFSEILKNIDSFNNPGLYVRSKLILIDDKATEMVQNISKSAPVEVPVSKSVSKEKFASKPDKPAKSKPTVNNSNHKFDLTLFLEKIGESEPRLEVILEASSLEVDDRKLSIKNQFQFNLKYIDKAKSRELIQKTMQDLFSLTLEIETEQADVEPLSSNKDEVIHDSQPATNEVSEEKKEDTDNTDLVESLL